MRIAVYAGTFDPITRGHLSVVERAASLFDRVIVLIAVNPDKQPLFSVGERLEMILEATRVHANVSAESTTGYVVKFANSVGARFLVRGVRSCTDVEGEITLANLNHRLAPEISTVFIPAHPDLSEVSSSRLKELVRSGADVSKYCTAHVVARLTEKLPPLAHGLEEPLVEV